MIIFSKLIKTLKISNKALICKKTKINLLDDYVDENNMMETKLVVYII